MVQTYYMKQDKSLILYHERESDYGDWLMKVQQLF